MRMRSLHGSRRRRRPPRRLRGWRRCRPHAFSLRQRRRSLWPRRRRLPRRRRRRRRGAPSATPRQRRSSWQGNRRRRGRRRLQPGRGWMPRLAKRARQRRRCLPPRRRLPRLLRRRRARGAQSKTRRPRRSFSLSGSAGGREARAEGQPRRKAVASASRNLYSSSSSSFLSSLGGASGCLSSPCERALSGTFRSLASLSVTSTSPISMCYAVVFGVCCIHVGARA
mmetsp:Transcript_6387/g.20469  ORF Transcript_6387/g.20469 Transcript_6387/m.20469 type:complete len:225 (+) Transcript_6387:232-906(+)